MTEIYGNIFDSVGHVDALCITTNLALRNNGKAICGAGIALAARQRWPFFEDILGYAISHGSHSATVLFSERNTLICSFPTKYHWKEKSSLSLIQESISSMANLSSRYCLNKISITRPGCGNGGLSWEQVRPVVVSFPLSEKLSIYHN